MSEEAKWYVAHTFSGYENKVASNIQTVVENHDLKDVIQDVVIPTETVKEIKNDGTEKEYQRKLMPGYVFVKMVMTDDTWYIVRNIRGCTGFVGPEGEPQPLTEEEVRKNNLEKVVVKLSYDVGDKVIVVDGPLETFKGVVETIDVEANSVRATISMFGRDTSVDFDLNQLEKIEEE